LNALTDVPGVRVGHCTLIRGENVRTGVTAILPHVGNLFRSRVPAGIHVFNGFGKLVGFTQAAELGELETPILLTNTLSAFTAANALVEYTLAQPGSEAVRSVNPVVGETNDGELNDIRGRHVTTADCLEAIRCASDGVIEEGCVGAGTGTVAFGWKAGIGTASRIVHAGNASYTLGVLVQTNYGGNLTIAGAPIGEELKHSRDKAQPEKADGSVMIVIATDAPVDARNLQRIAARSVMALGRTGAAGSNGSGDYAIAFSTSESVRRDATEEHQHALRTDRVLPNSAMSPLFAAAIESTEEAVYNSLFRATTTSGMGNTREALPLEETIEILRRYGCLPN
jgi:D-aminopeptidase